MATLDAGALKNEWPSLLRLFSNVRRQGRRRPPGGDERVAS